MGADVGPAVPPEQSVHRDYCFVAGCRRRNADPIRLGNVQKSFCGASLGTMWRRRAHARAYPEFVSLRLDLDSAKAARKIAQCWPAFCTYAADAQQHPSCVILRTLLGS